MVTKDALPLTVGKIRGRSTEDLLAEIKQENPLITQAIQQLSLRSIPANRRVVIEREFAAIYELLKTAGRLDQAENNEGKT